MARLFRTVLASIGVRPLTPEELDTLADIHEGKIHSWNWLGEHPAGVYRRLESEGYIYFHSQTGVGGRWHLSSNLPPNIAGAIEAHLRSFPPGTRLSGRRKLARQHHEQRARLAISESERGAILAAIQSQPYLHTMEGTVRLSGSASGGKVLVHSDKIHALCDRILDGAEISELNDLACKKEMRWPLSDRLDVYALNLHCKLELANALARAPSSQECAPSRTQAPPPQGGPAAQQ